MLTGRNCKRQKYRRVRYNVCIYTDNVNTLSFWFKIQSLKAIIAKFDKNWNCVSIIVILSRRISETFRIPSLQFFVFQAKRGFYSERLSRVLIFMNLEASSLRFAFCFVSKTQQQQVSGANKNFVW